MAVILAGASYSVRVPAGSVLSGSGSGSVSFAPGDLAGVGQQISGRFSLGPFSGDATAYLSASTSSLLWFIAPAPSDTQVAIDRFGRLVGLTTPTGGTRAFPQALPRRGNVGMRVFGGRMGNFNNATIKTFHVALTVAQGFDAVRVILANGSSGGTVAVGGVRVSAAASAADLNNSSATWTSGTFAGSATGTIPAAGGANRRGYLVSDWIQLASLDRTDGGQFPLLMIRAYITTAATISVFGNGTDVFTNWVTRPNGRIWCMRHQDGDQITTPSGFTSTTNQNQSPIIGIQYASRGTVVNVGGFGDSITEGRGTYIGEGWGVPACEQLSDPSGVCVEWSNFAWASTPSTSQLDIMQDTIAAGLAPDIAFFGDASPNDFGSTITATEVRGARFRFVRSLGVCAQAEVFPVPWTTLPVNPSVKNWQSSDSLRRDYNSVVMGFIPRGYDVQDFSALISGETDVNGQVNLLPGSTADGIHPNDYGNSLFTPVAQNVIQRFIWP